MASRCVACLSTRRSTKPVLKLYKFIGVWRDVQFKAADHVCWECEAMFRKISKFKQQVLKAQSMLKDQHFQPINEDFSLSNLTYEPNPYKNYICYKEILKHESEYTEYLEEDFLDTSEYYDVKTEDSYEENNSKMDPMTQLAIKMEIPERNHDELDDIALERSVQDAIHKKQNKRTDKFTVRQMKEEEMLAARAEDRKKPRYMKCPFKCETCIIGYHAENIYRRHVLEKHNGPAEFRCRVCLCTLTNEGRLKQHLKSHYIAYQCSLCQFDAHKLPLMLQHHVKMHHKSECRACNLQFT